MTYILRFGKQATAEGEKDTLFGCWASDWEPQALKIYSIDENRILIVGNKKWVYDVRQSQLVQPSEELIRPGQLGFQNRRKCFLSFIHMTSEVWIGFRCWEQVYRFKTLGIYLPKRDLKASVKRIASRANDLNVGDSFDFVRGHSAFGEDGIQEAARILIPALKNDDPEIRRIACRALYELACHVGPIRDLRELGGVDSLMALRRTISPLGKLIRREQDQDVLRSAQRALKEFQDQGLNPDHPRFVLPL